MRKLTKREQRLLARIINKMKLRSEELNAMLISLYAPDLWLDFLNADPRDSDSMWPVYMGYIRFIESLRDENSCSREIEEMMLLSKGEFLEHYPLELQEDAEKLHKGMKRVIDEGHVELISAVTRFMPETLMDEEELEFSTRHLDDEEYSKALAVLTNGADIPDASFTASLVPAESPDIYKMHLHTHSADHRNFWLFVILDGMLISSCRGHEMAVRTCAAPDCGRYFVPASHAHGQKYHSTTCRSRHNMQKRRKANP